MFATVWLALCLILVYIAAFSIYRLYLNPLAKIPGPKIAALTGFYEVYYDLCQEGRFPWKLKELHEQYGPIVRIAPNEVHINDPAFIPIHFATSSIVKRNKYVLHQQQLGVPDSVMSTVDADLHHIRRSALAPFLSKPSVAAYEPLIRAKIEDISARLGRFKSDNKIVELRLLFWCMTTDIITGLAFFKPMGLLSGPELNPDYRAFAVQGQRKLNWFKHFPILWTALRRIPPEWLISMAPEAKMALDWETSNKAVAQELVSRFEQFPNHTIASDSTIFHHLLRSDLPPAEKRLPRIWQDGTSLVGAGVETISNTLCVTLFHLLRNPSSLSRLRAELATAIPDPTCIPPLHQLNHLPYLSAVIEEGLRKAMGVLLRFVRVAPNAAVAYSAEYTLPPGTAVSMSTLLVHGNPQCFPEPERFWPERWMIGNDSKGGGGGYQASKSQMLAFGKGPRTCVGMHLAYAELYITLATLARRFEFELYQTTERDVDAAHESVLPMPWAGSKGVRVRVR